MTAVKWLDSREVSQPVRAGHDEDGMVRLRLTPEAADALAKVLVRVDVILDDPSLDPEDVDVVGWMHTGIALLAAAAHATTEPPPPALVPLRGIAS